MVICETWLTDKINLFNKDYKTFQTQYAQHQGVCIITRTGNTTKVFKPNDPNLIAVQQGNVNPILIIGAYFKRDLRIKLLHKIKRFINRINKTHQNANIYLFCDLNPDSQFKPKKVTNELNLKFAKLNEKLITRSQKFKNETKES